MGRSWSGLILKDFMYDSILGFARPDSEYVWTHLAFGIVFFGLHILYFWWFFKEAFNRVLFGNWLLFDFGDMLIPRLCC